MGIENESLLDSLLNQADGNDYNIDDNEDLQQPIDINLDQINDETSSEALEITDGLSAAFFSEKYMEEHQFIKNKIIQETQNIRRLLKILKVNEKAQDVLICNIARTPGKASLYGNLSGMQSTMLAVQKQLEEHQKNLETIFSDIQNECEKIYGANETEQDDDGSVMCKGARTFINSIKEKINTNIYNSL